MRRFFAVSLSCASLLAALAVMPAVADATAMHATMRACASPGTPLRR